MSLGFPRSAHQLMVDEFMMKAGQRLPTVPSLLTKEERLLRAKLIFEEAIETIRDGLRVNIFIEKDSTLVCVTMHNDMDFVDDTSFEIDTEEMDLLQTIDGCNDIKVVTTGTLSALGIPDVRFQKLVDDNNLDKFGPEHKIREDGKLIKPPNHQPPNIAGLLEEYKSWLRESH